MPSLIDLRSGKTKTIATIFKVTERIGSGHFAEVYKAYNLRTETDMALKIYLGYDERSKHRAKEEIEVLQKLDELNTDYFPQPKKGLRIYKTANRNHPFIPMELCEYIENDGKSKRPVSLREIMPVANSETNPQKEIPEFWEYITFVNFILYICDAVHMLHKQDIIHRDLKPANILLKNPYGETAIKPFFIDFNTSSRSGDQLCLGGTESYLPPEVLSEKRKISDPADDLWAVAKIVFELLFGIGQQIKGGLETHSLIDFSPPTELTEHLLKALSAKPNDRFLNAEEFHNAFINCFPIEGIGTEEPEEEDLFISSDEIIWIRENKSRIVGDIIKVLSGENEIPVFKEIKDHVSSIYSSLYQDDTESFDLKDEIVRLGTNAIPVIIEESYKLIHDSEEFKIISNALEELSLQKPVLAKRAIEIYCVSSDYSVRKMSRILCDKIQFFPTNLIDSIIENDALYLPEERVNIADICIKWSTDSDVMMSLNRYMCREYTLDQQRYLDLRDKIALRMKELNFEEKAALILEDTKMRIWEELPEYEALDESLKRTVDEGLLQLFADAFSCLGEEALNYIQQAGLPIRCDKEQLPIRRNFYFKLAMRYAPARQELFKMLKRLPTKEVFYAVKKLYNLTDEEKEIFANAAMKLQIEVKVEIDFPELFERYLIQGLKNDRYTLCHEGGITTIKLIKNKITDEYDPEKIKRILSLFEFYRNRHRNKVLELLTDHWDTFSNTDYVFSVHVLTEYNLPSIYKQKAIDLLNLDISNSARQEAATKAIDKLLQR